MFGRRLSYSILPMCWAALVVWRSGTLQEPWHSWFSQWRTEAALGKAAERHVNWNTPPSVERYSYLFRIYHFFYQLMMLVQC